MKWSSLQKVGKFVKKKFYEIDPGYGLDLISTNTKPT